MFENVTHFLVIICLHIKLCLYALSVESDSDHVPFIIYRYVQCRLRYKYNSMILLLLLTLYCYCFKKNLEKQAKQHVPKIKTPSIDEEIDMEGWSEIEDDVIEDDAKLTTRSTQSTKSNKSKSPANNKENSLKRQKGNHIFKRQKSKEPLSPTKSKSTGKAKTPDHDLKSKKSATLKKENAAKRKISMKQDPARYDNFLKTSSSYQRRLAAKETSGSNKCTSGSSIGPSEKRLRSSTRVTRSSSSTRLANQSNTTTVRRTPSFNCSPAGRRAATAKSSSVRRVNNTKRNTSVNRSTTVSKVRRKSSVRKIMNESTTTTAASTTEKRMMTRSSSGNLSRKSVEKLPQVTKKAKNLKRSIGKTSLEGNAPSTEEKSFPPNQSTGSSVSKRARISSLPVPTISVTSPVKAMCSDGVPMSPSPFVFETTSLSDKVGNRLCPLGKRSRLPQSSGMVGRFLRDHRAASISVCSPVREEICVEAEDTFQELQPQQQEQLPPPILNLTDNSAPRALTAAGRKLRRQSNFKLVRLNSVKNKRKSMLRTVAKSKMSK